MPITFPSNPTLNDTYTYSGVTWTYNGKGWTKASSGGGALTENSVTTSTIADAAVTTAKIANSSVTIAKWSLGTDYIPVASGNTAQRSNSTPLGGIRYNTTTGYGEMYTSAGWAIIGQGPPSISTVVPSTFTGEAGTSFSIQGTNFTSDITVKFISNAGTEYTAATVTFVNSGEVTATTPQDFTVADEPLDVKVIQNSGQATRADAIDCGGAPSWSTASGSLGTFNDNGASISVTVAATDPDAGATIAYSVVSGSLPSGITLNASTGVISGTTPSINSDTTYNFTIRATDNAGNYVDRAFSMVILVSNYFGSGADGAGSF